MTNRETTESCPICDSQNTEIRFDRERHFKYLRHPHVLEGLEHTFCLDCGCSFNAKGQIERNNQRFIEFEKSILDGIIAPRKIVELRQIYNLTQEQAKYIFKTTGNLFSKWERGESAPSSAVSNLLEAALEDRVIMERLARRAGISLVDSQTIERKMEKSIVSIWANTFPQLISDRETVEDHLVVIGEPHAQLFLGKGHHHAVIKNGVTIHGSRKIESMFKTLPADDDSFSQCPEPYMIGQFGAMR